MTGAPTDDVCACKIGRQREQYGLRDLDVRLVGRRREDGESLRDLASFVNTRVLAAALEGAGADVAGDPRSVYEALTGDDVAPERRADVVDRLELVGIDVAALESDFVSHQTVKTHLSDCLDVDTSRSGIDSVEEGRAKLDWAAERHRTVAESVVDQLVRADRVSLGEYELTQTTSITCRDCGTTYRADEFLRRGRCECDGDGA